MKDERLQWKKHKRPSGHVFLICCTAFLLTGFYLAGVFYLFSTLPIIIDSSADVGIQEDVAVVPPKELILHNRAEGKIMNSRAKRKVLTAPPFPFATDKTFFSTETPKTLPIVTAYLSRGYKRVREQWLWHEKAVFAWHMQESEYTRRHVTMKPWQRPNWAPGTVWLDDQAKLSEVLENNGSVSPANKKWESSSCCSFSTYFPETYRLCDKESQKRFLERMDNDDKEGVSSAWVMKASRQGRGRGITFLGPQSTNLKTLRKALKSSEKPVPNMGRRDSYMAEICEANSVIQRYTKNLLAYRKHKFSVRSFFLVASFEPLVIYFYPGYLQVSPYEYSTDDFSDGNNDQHFSQPIRPLDEGRVTIDEKEEWEISFDDYSEYLKEDGVDEITPMAHGNIKADPASHIRLQMKEAIVALVDTYHDLAFSLEPYRKDFAPENAYVLFGVDFFIRKDLSVLIFDINTFPGVGPGHGEKESHPLKPFLPEMVDIITEVYEKQLKGENVMPIQSAHLFELIYTEDEP